MEIDGYSQQRTIVCGSLWLSTIKNHIQQVWWNVAAGLWFHSSEAAECLQDTNEKLASCSLECQKLQQDLCHWVHFEIFWSCERNFGIRNSRIPRQKKKDYNVMLYYVVHMYIIIYFCFKTEASLILNAFQQAEWCDRYVLFESNHELLCPLPFQASLGDFQGRESSQRAENRALWQDLKQAICGRSSGATRRTHQIRILLKW